MRIKLTESQLKRLTEGVSINTEDEWCKTNLTDSENQICIIKTPNSADQSTCQKQIGSFLRTQYKEYTSHIKTDVKETNFCKSIWSKITS